MTTAASEGTTTPSRLLNFVLIGKVDAGENHPFFATVKDGCQDEATKLTNDDEWKVECRYVGPRAGEEQSQIIRRLIQQRQVHGIALSALDGTSTLPALAEARQAGIPVVTFDSDINEPTSRLAYIGTDDYAFGQALGKLAVQLRPQGGSYAIVSSHEAPNLNVRVAAIRDYFSERSGIAFTEVAQSPSDCHENTTLALEQVEDYLRLDGDQTVDVIIPVGGWPMFQYEPWRDMVNRYRQGEESTSTYDSNNRNTTLVVADTFPNQIRAITSGHVDGLVGQDPYKMGAMCVKHLLDAYSRQQHSKESDFGVPGVTTTPTQNTTVYGTVFVEMVRRPLHLPDARINNNYLGKLRILGFTFFGVIATMAAAMLLWTICKRNVRVVMVSQPKFLFMLCFGVLVFGSTLLPMSFDDSIVSNQVTLNRLCMATPWLGSLGFTIIFAALFSKIWRINKIFKNPSPQARVKIAHHDLYLPLILLLGINAINLSLWTTLAPLQFVRRTHVGTDGWNRVISTYGTCTSSSIQYAIIMALTNVGAVVIANWQAYEARTIHSDFSESKYVGIAMVIITQAFITGVPILFLVKEMSRVYYVVLTTMLFTTSVAILLLIFIPKIIAERKYTAQVLAERKKHLSDSVAAVREKRFGFNSRMANNGSNPNSLLEAQDLGTNPVLKGSHKGLVQEALDQDS